MDAIIKHYGEPSYRTSDNNRYLLYWGFDNDWELRPGLDAKIKARIADIPPDAEFFPGSPGLPSIDTLGRDSINNTFNSYFGKVFYIVLRTDRLRPKGIQGSKGGRSGAHPGLQGDRLPHGLGQFFHGRCTPPWPPGTRRKRNWKSGPKTTCRDNRVTPCTS